LELAKKNFFKMEKCLFCKKEFKSERGLHSHLKVHGGKETYYQTFYPKTDLYDNSAIQFKNKDQYFSSFFNSDENRKAFYKSYSNLKLKKQTAIKEISDNLKFRNCEFLPSQSFFELAPLPDIRVIKDLFNSCSQFCQNASLDPLFTKKLPKTFFSDSLDLDSMKIFIDSREQNPFDYKNSMVNKLDFGDYTAAGDFYSKVFIERKALGDFASSLSSGYQRFKKELDRAKQFNSYIVMVVEGSLSDVENHVNSLKKGKRPNLSYAFHNARNLLIEYATNFQIVFCNGRDRASELAQRILFFGKEATECDLQYYLSNVD
jgi:hypothetical protein